MLRWAQGRSRPSHPVGNNVASEDQGDQSGDDEYQDEEHKVSFVDSGERRSNISSTNLCDVMNKERFDKLLQSYPKYIREVYQDVEQDRFKHIPDRLNKLEKRRKSFYLTQTDLISMDQWMQKRGTPLKQHIHQRNANRIARNSEQQVIDTTKKAFKRYRGKNKPSRLSKAPDQRNVDGIGTGTVNDIIPAMDILKDGLSGVHRARANLLLSIPFYENVPYCSRALYRWLNWDEQFGWSLSFTWTDAKLKETIEKVQELAKKHEVNAVDVEKVSFVLEREGLIEAFKKRAITESVFESGQYVGETQSTQLRSVVGSEVGINGEKKVAIKQIYKGLNLRLRFLAEVMISNKLTNLSSERFVKFYGWNENKNFLYIAMELVEEGDLQKALKENPEIWTESAIKVATTQILEGLEFMHEAYIAHRDLKPQNILVVSSQPERIQIKIADFGISKRLSDRGTTVLRTGAGTSGYKAPEVVEQWRQEIYAEGKQDGYSFSVDIWSLGCIIYRMAKRERLFTADYSKTDRILPKKVKEITGNLTKEKRMGRTGIKFVCSLIKIKPEQRPNVHAARKSLEGWDVRP